MISSRAAAQENPWHGPNWALVWRLSPSRDLAGITARVASTIEPFVTRSQNHTTRPDESPIQVAVKALGIGMSDEERERLFDKFFRADRPEVRSLQWPRRSGPGTRPAGMGRYRRMVIVTRLAGVDDASAMGGVHVRAWRAAYRGQMPDDYLDAISAENRAEMWRSAMGRPRGHPSILVVERDGEVIGFASVGPADADESGELYSINVDPAAWGVGAGRALLEAAQDELRALGHRDAILWVHPENDRARRFYETAGWKNDGVERTQEVLGVMVPEIRYSRPLQ